MDIQSAYIRLRDFADQFANSSAGISSSVSASSNERNSSAVRKIERTFPVYAVKEDNYFGDLLENKYVRNCLKHIADKYYGKQIEDITSHATLLTPNNYPSLYDVYDYCCQTLGITNKPTTYITNKLHGINALSVEIENKQIILLSRKAAIALSPEEQAFVLGHELGHHQQGNLVCHTVNGLLNSMNDKSEILGPMIMDAVDVPLKRWCRRSEYNADRAGLHCCKDLSIVRNLFIRLGMIENVTIYHQYKETEEDHPMLISRLAELQEYSKTI